MTGAGDGSLMFAGGTECRASHIENIVLFSLLSIFSSAHLFGSARLSCHFVLP